MKKYRDFYFRKAKQECYPARSVYKLKELNKKFKIFSPGQKILDLGAAPGSWTMFAARQVGPCGLVLAVDLQPLDLELPSQVRTFQDNVLEPGPELHKVLEASAPLDVIISDMAPKTSGIKFRDQALSLELAEQAFFFAEQYLRPGGDLVVKVFWGPDVPDFLQVLKRHFFRVKTFKPKSSRAESKESFLVAREKKEY